VGKLVASGVLKTAVAIVQSPLFGFMLAITLMIAVVLDLRARDPAARDRCSGGCSSSRPALQSRPRRNDAQKNHGHHLDAAHSVRAFGRERPLPFCGTRLPGGDGLGTLFGGWRIVKPWACGSTKLKRSAAFVLPRAAR